MTSLVDLNGFNINADGVYSKDYPNSFDYTDGAESEKALKEILSTVKNLASDSAELESYISDWPSEYHLSSARANLLRCLDLRGVKRVLELGCGCGSITRYLGEQNHLQVDSIEGSPSRAALTALRCRDLENVTISCANFNDIEFPEDFYDLVLFVGVTEYAGRFANCKTDQEALQDLLALAKKACTKQGIALVAIENRTGLKYMHGATEDHYGKPYVGLENYPESAGIRTYTKTEWQQQISKTGFSQHEFLYPFPDYKIPTCIIHRRALEGQRISVELEQGISKIKSRDYLQTFDLGNSEAMLWRGAYEAGCFADVANSFLILLSNSAESLKKMAAFSVREFAATDFSSRYNPQYDGVPVAGVLDAKSSTQISELRDQLKLLQQSRGWRWLERLRALKIPGMRPRQ